MQVITDSQRVKFISAAELSGESFAWRTRQLIEVIDYVEIGHAPAGVFSQGDHGRLAGYSAGVFQMSVNVGGGRLARFRVAIEIRLG